MLHAPNPILVRLWRGERIESVHRGAWALVDRAGRCLEGAGEVDEPIFARSAIKSLQALPLVESGAADAAGYDSADLALALSSHNGEPIHTERVAAILERLDLSPADLRCGPQVPGDEGTRRALFAAGGEPSPLHNNCSGKHAGFLALARHLGQDPLTYLEVDGEVQRAVRAAVAKFTGLRSERLDYAIDGCSAPTWRMPLSALGRAFATFSSTAESPACRRLCEAAAAHPRLIAGTHGRLCTEILRATAGRLFPKIGAEAVYAVGLWEQGLALVAKIDDGAFRAVHALIVHLLRTLELLQPGEAAALAHWVDAPLRNRAGLAVGHLEVTV